ncbi:endo-1,4-beta-xylanase [Agarivorans aestuarii]|uniref:endo-1,4-beta-xylanase n=1 Tax=Agarivorans aestuarii TaxID=1563703 RepID=UPI001C802D34|nr:endo-1,4-beta-xylanase [Agarivorans aestuarii]
MRQHAIKTGIFKVAALAAAFCSLQVNAAPLRDVVKGQDTFIGAALETRHLQDKQFAETLAREFNQLTPENEMKWSYLQPERGKFTFDKADKLVDFAQKNDMMVRGHALVWHIQNPDWLENGDFSKEEMLKIMEEHITAVVSHYKGKVKYWDVVNEALDDNGGWRPTLWYKALGEDYIAKAFEFAHEADPDAILVYNDYSTEGKSPKANAAYRLVKKLKEQGVPIHGIGTQAHLVVGVQPRVADIAANIERIKELGLEFHFTEIDMRMQDPATDRMLQQQANMYEDLANLTAYFDNVNFFTTWGISDKYSWIPHWFKGYDHGLMFDKQYQEKPAYTAVNKVFADKAQGKFDWEPPAPLADVGRRFEAFISNEAKQAMPLDGDIAKWKEAVFYPFAYNQLGGKDLTLPAESNISGRFALLFDDNTLYGRVERRDDKTVIGNKEQVWENDSVEVFLGFGEEFAQIRALVGEEFAPTAFQADIKNYWSEDGTVMEFSITPKQTDTLSGTTLGFNIALADNDAGPEAGRSAQLYPVPGTNNGWQGHDFGEVFFTAQNTEISDKLKGQVVSFKAEPVDGLDATSAFDLSQWENAYHYPFAFNQLNPINQTPPSQDIIHGTWRVAYSGNTLHGVVHRHDNKTVTTGDDWQADNIEIFIKVGEEFVQLRSIVGQDFQENTFPGKRVAKWNEDGTIMQFSIELPVDSLAGKTIDWNIALADNDDGESRSSQLYPVPGNNTAYLGEQLTILEFVK